MKTRIGIGGMMLTGEKVGVLEEKTVSVPLCTSRTGSGSNPGLRGERPTTNAVGHVTALFDIRL
jgi:hypothetical protein